MLTAVCFAASGLRFVWQCLGDLAQVVAVLVAAAVVVLCPAALALWALLPLVHPARAQHARRQFMLVDIFALCAGIQVLLSVTISLSPPLERGQAHIVFAIGAALFYAYLWFRGVGLLSAIGERRAWRRFLVLVLVWPGAVLAAIALMIALAALAAATWSGSLGSSAMAAAISLALAAALVLCRWLTRALVAPLPSSLLPQDECAES